VVWGLRLGRQRARQEAAAGFADLCAIGYNPLDYSGALGRYFRIGLKHQF